MAMKQTPFKKNQFKASVDSPVDRMLQEWSRRLDPEQIREILKEHQFEVGAVASTILVIFLMFTTTLNRFQQAADIDQDISHLTEKKKPMEAYKKVVKEKQDFLKNLVQGVPEKEFISFITGFAEKRGIVISEFQPATSKLEEYSITTTIGFSCSISSSIQALLFLHDLETANFSVKVSSFSLKGQDQGSLGLDKDIRQADLPMEMNIELSSVTLLENEEKKNKNK